MRKIKSFHPKGYTRILFTDGSQVLCKDMEPGNDTFGSYLEFKEYWDMSFNERRVFDHWTKAKDTVQIYTAISRVYFR